MKKTNQPEDQGMSPMEVPNRYARNRMFSNIDNEYPAGLWIWNKVKTIYDIRPKRHGIAKGIKYG